MTRTNGQVPTVPARAAAIACVALAMLSGCSGIENPTVRVVGPELGESSADGAKLVFTLVASNPNDSELPLMDVIYRARSDGRTIFEGRRSAQASAPREGESRVPLPIPVPNDTTIGGPLEISGKLRYRRAGRLFNTLARLGWYRSESFRFTEGQTEDPGPGEASGQEPERHERPPVASPEDSDDVQ